MPRVSIGMPVYNGEQFLKAAIESILAQTFADFELIISDNASTDRTQEICKAYAVKDQRIRYYRSAQNLGASWNHNRVFELSTGEYFKWSACDDVCKPEHLERCVEILDCKPSVILCYPKTIIIDEQGKFVENYPDNLNLNSSRPHERYKQFHDRFRYEGLCNIVYGLMRANLLRMTPLHGNYPASDKILLGELALRGEFYEIPEYLFLRREHSQRSLRAYPSLSQLAVWFDPTNRDRILLVRWQWLFKYLASIRQVPMSLHEKAYCYVEVGRWAWGKRRGLTRDLKNLISAKTQHPKTFS
jgi:glycosyltransferase involved in cell wall biosynthesis